MSEKAPDQFPELYFNELTMVDIAEAGEAIADWIAVIPVAATEQHGPHLPLGTDAMINEGLIKRFAEGLGEKYPVTFLPTQHVGKSDEHIGFPGTLTLTAETAVNSWLQIAESLGNCGIGKVVFLNSHGGNSALLEQICLDLRHKNMLGVATSWSRLADHSGEVADIFGPDEKSLGMHGGDIETSLMLALRPELVRLEMAENFHSAQAEFKEENYGVVGNAEIATADKGEAMIKLMLGGFEKLVQDVQNFDMERFL